MDIRKELDQPLVIKKRTITQAHNELDEINKKTTQNEKKGSSVKKLKFGFGVKPFFVSAEVHERIFGGKNARRK